VRKISISGLRTLGKKELGELRGPLMVDFKHATLAVIIPYEQFLAMQRAILAAAEFSGWETLRP
jgi:hypothetical protein